MTNPLPWPVNPLNALIWHGASGTTYELQNYRIGTVFNPVPGVYIFTRLGADGRWYAVYIGQTDNLKRRLTDELTTHHQIAESRRHGATHISAMVVSGGDATRLKIETDLRHGQNPPCNEQ